LHTTHTINNTGLKTNSQTKPFQVQPNVPVAQANASLGKTNEALGQVNASLTQENESLTQANESLAQANLSLTQANASLGQTNESLTQANEALCQENEALAQANASLGQENTSLCQANVSHSTTHSYNYHASLNLGLSYVDSRCSSFIASSPQTYLAGRLSHTLSYSNSGTKINLCAYKYNADGTMAYEIHQFDKAGLQGGTHGMVQGITYKTYNLRGAIQEIIIDDGLNGSPDMSYLYDYDGWNRMTNVYANNNKIAEYNYIDELGLVSRLRYFGKGASCTVQVDDINYTYDTRDRLTNINAQLFEETLYYDSNLPNTGNALTNVSAQTNYNGNINATQALYKANLAANYGTIGNAMDGATYYGYTYDGMNRLTKADASVMNVLSSVSASTDPELKYGDEQLSYDRIGNIITLKRGAYYLPGTPTPTNEVSNWRYKYTTGTNKLYQIVENVSPYTTQIANYTYDENGSMRTDDKNTISGSSYGRSNLPFSVTAHSTVNNYLYDANNGRIYNENVGGTEKYYLRSASGATIGTYNIGDTEWEWEVAGSNHIATLTSSKTQYYEYDHLGGVRTTYVTSINCSTSVVSYNVLNMSDYYANGKLLRNFAGIALDQYGYQGSEREHAISDNDYYTLFRGLDADIVRWKQFDPKWQPNWSPFASMDCNPVLHNDVLGDYVDVDKKKYYTDKNGQYQEKKWHNIFKKTTMIEKNITVHNAKLYYDLPTHPISEKEKQSIANSIEQNIKNTWNGKISKENGKGPIVNVNVNFEGGIEVVNSLDKVNAKGRKSDHLYIITSDKVVEGWNRFFHSGDAAALTLSSNFVIFSWASATQRLGHENAPAHEFGHQGGEDDFPNDPNHSIMDGYYKGAPTYQEMFDLYNNGPRNSGYKIMLNKYKRKAK
jgi:hypothetical protein